MQQSPQMLWRYLLMLIGIRRSKDLLEQFQEFECSSLFAFNYCVYCTTRQNTCGRIGTKWLFFFTLTEECCVVMEKNIGKKLPNRISDQVWYKRCLKGTLGRGVQICEWGSISAGGFGPGMVKQLRTFVDVPNDLSRFSKIGNVFFFRWSVWCQHQLKLYSIKHDL